MRCHYVIVQKLFHHKMYAYLKNGLRMAKIIFVLPSDVTFVGHGTPAGTTTMYMMGECVLQDERDQREIGQAVIQPNRTWSVTVSLPLPCRLRWKWKANHQWELRGGEDRYTNLSMSATVLYSKFGQNQEVKPRGK